MKLGFLSPALLACFLASGAAAQRTLAPSECPQPRFTGKAPDEIYERKNPLPPAPDLKAAERIYRGDGGQIACASCHGARGDGRGPMSGMFDPRPRNFACAQTVNGIPDGQLFWVIRFGSPGTSMPPHPKLSDEQLWQLILLLRRFAN